MKATGSLLLGWAVALFGCSDAIPGDRGSGSSSAAAGGAPDASASGAGGGTGGSSGHGGAGGPSGSSSASATGTGGGGGAPVSCTANVPGDYPNLNTAIAAVQPSGGTI